MFDENLLPLSPLPFFQLQTPCYHLDTKSTELEVRKKQYLLPSLDKLTQEEPFAIFHMGWNESGLYFFVEVERPFQDAFYPDVSRGDSVELFIDTRDVKTTGFATKFSHHFFFLPQSVDGHKAGEITRFRTEDAHELCDPQELHVKSEIKKNGYHLNIYIPTQCLSGYDPDQFGRLGFTYRVNRLGNLPQHFSVLSSEFKIEQQPSLWSSLNLVKENNPIRQSSQPKG